MELTTKFNLGQEVWAITSSSATRIVHCETCKREGVVTIGGEQFTCPKCGGTSKHPRHIGQRWYVSEHSTIGKVEVERYSRPDQIHEDKVSYMIEETGIGSGLIWKEDRLFATEREALEACAALNAGRRFDDDK
jgi:predicted RNA-binding Zn-ribbon protein involved in translation (DUF1610 family)